MTDKVNGFAQTVNLYCNILSLNKTWKNLKKDIADKNLLRDNHNKNKVKEVKRKGKGVKVEVGVGVGIEVKMGKKDDKYRSINKMYI